MKFMKLVKNWFKSNIFRIKLDFLNFQLDFLEKFTTWLFGKMIKQVFEKNLGLNPGVGG